MTDEESTRKSPHEQPSSSRKPYQKPEIIWVESIAVTAYEFACGKLPAQGGQCDPSATS
jgi:hypothetical protein